MYLFLYREFGNWFQFLVLGNIDAISVLVKMSLCTGVRNSLGYILRSRTAGLEIKLTFTKCGCCQTTP